VQALGDIFELFDGPTGLASEIGEKADTVLRWKIRSRIPDHAWGSVIRAVERRGKQLSLSQLLAMNKPKRSRWDQPAVGQ
jgi:hypothetical protein